jgi:hypothetical protein
MHTRRTFIEGALAVSALATGGLAATRAASARPDHVLVDGTLAEGAAFRGEMRVQGIDVIDMPDDIANLWMRVLEPRLRAAPAIVVGLTHAAALFCLEALARDYGLRTTLRIEHARLDVGPTEHRALGLASGAGWESALRQAGTRWPAIAARLVAERVNPAQAAVEWPLVEVAAANRRRRPALFTWMLAPDHRRRALLTRY